MKRIWGRVIIFPFLFLFTLTFAPSVLAACTVNFPISDLVPPGGHIYARINDLTCGSLGIRRSYHYQIVSYPAGTPIAGCQETSSTGSPCIWDIDITAAPTSPGTYQLGIYDLVCGAGGSPQCGGFFTVHPNATPQPRPSPASGSYDICQANPVCIDCRDQGNSWTAIGCLQTSDTQAFIIQLFQIASGIAGGIAILLIIFGAFQVITAAGSPEKIQKGQQAITSAIAGLLFIIFSLFLLKLIGADILKIPNFSTP